VKAITYTIKQDIKTLSDTINSILCDIALEHFISNEIIFELKVVLNELITNALCHGNKCELEKLIYVTLKLVSNKYLYISVKDEGFGFKPKINNQSIDVYLEEVNTSLCEHGRGLVIVNSLCDKVKFNRCGNKVSILKNLEHI
jgi:serine/threonine-protein kinase RsbW